MKFCELCGEEISTKDGDNCCARCDDDQPPRDAKRRRRERESVLRDLGLVKVRGSLGGTYWE